MLRSTLHCVPWMHLEAESIASLVMDGLLVETLRCLSILLPHKAFSPRFTAAGMLAWRWLQPSTMIRQPSICTRGDLRRSAGSICCAARAFTAARLVGPPLLFGPGSQTFGASEKLIMYAFQN